MIIKFSSEDVKKCEEFANKIDTAYYASRKQTNNEKRIKDQVIGKLGEIATYLYFQSKGVELTQPDFKLYSRAEKSWDFDMKGEGINLHVKSQAVYQARKYGESWIFQNEDKHIFKDVSEKDYVCFALVDADNGSAEIKSVVKLSDLHSKELFKKPKLIHLSSKSAVYFADLKSSLKENLFAK
jgi:hypothetical protein